MQWIEKTAAERQFLAIARGLEVRGEQGEIGEDHVYTSQISMRRFAARDHV